MWIPLQFVTSCIWLPGDVCFCSSRHFVGNQWKSALVQNTCLELMLEWSPHLDQLRESSEMTGSFSSLRGGADGEVCSRCSSPQLTQSRSSPMFVSDPWIFPTPDRSGRQRQPETEMFQSQPRLSPTILSSKPLPSERTMRVRVRPDDSGCCASHARQAMYMGRVL